ncbi:uncharacterized protein LOC123535886 [Mercenaria mercenaria]|uniref:uncharacterized protein LOC123535886 n=1 Tax=Mercenaria mercenaria TaxID=6596 RepID=UPI001E1DC2A3|nr:uncharacterized protein LOC123535886 [Mercenaria mercenaria]
MAVSDIKVADFQGSISKGSAEDFDHRCEPCLAIGQQIEAHGFCVDCQEYLCKNCFAYHRRTKASKHHQLVNTDNMDKHAIIKNESDECNEKCQVHKKEVIKFFCPKHEALGCNDCIVLNHRACNIDYIPDKCAGIGDSAEYGELLRELDQKVNEADNIIKQASLREKELDYCHDNLLKEITMFRKEINDRLDQLQKQIKTTADKKISIDKITVKKVLETCSTTSSDIKQLQSRLQDYKASQQNGQLYITMKQAKSKCKTDELKEADICLEKTNMQYIFEQNQDLRNMLSRQNAFGQLTHSSSVVASKRMKPINKLTHKENINMNTKSDPIFGCLIAGCVILSSNKVVAADFLNEKLKVVDMKNKAVIEETTLSSKPWDIAVVPQDHIAVTLPDKKEILILTTAGKLSSVRKFPVKGECRGIAYHKGHLYIVCSDSKCVFIIDIQGNVQNTILLDNKRFDNPHYLLLSKDLRHIFISDEGSNSIVSITLQGDISAEYKKKDFKKPRGMMMLDDGSLFVCPGLGNHSIRRISSDLKQCHTMIDNLSSPQSMCYNRDQHEVYVGCCSNRMNVLSAK